MLRGRAALLLVLAAAPFAFGGAPYVLVDPAGDQEAMLPLVSALFGSQQTGWLLQPYDPQGVVCDDPRADINAVVASATSERIRLEVAVTDATASVICAGTPVHDLPQMDGYPFFRIALQRGSSGAVTQVATAISTQLANGTFEQCVRYYEADLEVCGPQDARVIDFPTVIATPGGALTDLRGVSYRIVASSVDAYGSWEPRKAKPLVFLDNVDPTAGYPFAVPSGD